MKCKNCQNVIPAKRVDLGYNICIECSSEKPRKWEESGFHTREGYMQMRTWFYND